MESIPCPEGSEAQSQVVGGAAGLLATAEDALRRSQRRLEILATAGEALSRSLDPEETLRAIGDATVPAIADWCRIDLLDEQGVSQRRLAHHVDPQLAARALARARQLQASTRTRGSIAWVMRTGESHYGQFEEAEAQADDALRSFTGEFGMRAHYIIPLVARGRTIGAMAIIQAESGRDLTPEDRSLILELGRRAALALDNARLYSAANAANLAKDEFLAMLGHELRNPLAPISTALELMARSEPDAHVQERRIIGRQVAHLSRLIDDLLDISRITRGKVQLLREPVDMKEVVANAVEATQPLFEKRRHPLQVAITPQPAIVTGDAVRLVQVICNLLTNAAKFTSAEDCVSLTLSSTADERVEVTVHDTGAGIDAQLLPRVFDLFVQGRQGSDRSAGGLGLGLSIVRSLVEMHGGEVAARSEGPGRGSSFTVQLPAAREQLPQTRAPSPSPIAAACGGRVLIVDDNVDAAETLAEVLRVSGYEARCAHRADEAMGMCGDFRPQLALLDIGLPEVDGYELAQMLRSSEFGSGIRLVALTGYGRDNDRARALGAGFDEHLVKPASIDKLLGVLQRLVSSPASP